MTEKNQLRISPKLSGFVSNALVILFLFVLLSILLVRFSGCSESTSPAESLKIPEPQGKKCFFVNSLDPIPVQLERRGKIVDFSIPKGFPMVVRDLLTNSASSALPLKECDNGYAFNLNSGGKMQFLDQGVILFKGSLRMEFHKVKERYIVKTLVSTLGIRGTTLILSVEPDGGNTVYLAEGKVDLETSSKQMQLEPGNKYNISYDGSTISKNPLSPDDFLKLAPDGGSLKLWQK
ncbi:MAG: hypothetical protein HQM10_08160 [Candidatus Riflebacteria bacterium]|nr:hypothetical protein [Candidatus Riflebacteria bacterium]